MFIAMRIREKVVVSVIGSEIVLPVSGMADGCIGCLLVFEDKISAAEYAGKDGQVLEVDYKN